MAEKKKIAKEYYLIALMRISLGLIFVWAFLDKLTGLGFSTCREAESSVVNYFCQTAWLEGGSPTAGYLEFATRGPFADLFQNLTGNVLVDWLFMMGLLLIGISLVLGIGINIAVKSGVLLLSLLWLSALPPEHHPFIDEHIIYILGLFIILATNDKQVMGYGNLWSQEKIVKSYPTLQ